MEDWDAFSRGAGVLVNHPFASTFRIMRQKAWRPRPFLCGSSTPFALQTSQRAVGKHFPARVYIRSISPSMRRQSLEGTTLPIALFTAAQWFNNPRRTSRGGRSKTVGSIRE